jgi:hypothetical protein
MLPSSSHYRFFIAAMGPGEIGQGIAFARYALNRGDSVIFSIPSRNYSPLIQLKNPRFSSLITKNSIVLKNALRAKKPDVLILCNSKIFTRKDNFHRSPPKPKIPTLSIDSNWLFSPSSPYIFNPWVDRYCINLPEPIFQLGLKKNGGHYTIPKEILKKIKVVGLIPSYRPLSIQEKEIIRKEYKIKKDEKAIFLYTSMGYLAKPIVFFKAYEVAKKLRAKGRKIKVIYFSDSKIRLTPEERNWFLIRPLTNAEHFSKVLASSDLVFQHQGLATLEQAIGLQIPVIANVRDRKDEKDPKHHRHSWEVKPFARYGVCAMFFFRSSINAIAKQTENLLFNAQIRETMRRKQKTLYKEGEAEVYNEVIKLLRIIKNY